MKLMSCDIMMTNILKCMSVYSVYNVGTEKHQEMKFTICVIMAWGYRLFLSGGNKTA